MRTNVAQIPSRVGAVDKIEKLESEMTFRSSYTGILNEIGTM